MLQTTLHVFCVLFKIYCRLFGHTPILGIHVVQSLLALKYKNNTSCQTDQMAEWYGASASGSVDLRFDSESRWVKPMTLKMVFTASPLDAQHLRDSVEKAGKFTCAVGKGT